MEEAPTSTQAPSPGILSRFLRFGTVGGTGAVVNLVILASLVEIAGWKPLLASVLAIEASTLTNFFLNRAWTWRDRRASLWSLFSYHGVVLVGLLAQWGAMAILVQVFGLHYLAAAGLGIGAGTAWNFLANHRFTFTAWTPERRTRHRRVFLYLVAFLVQVAVASVLTHDWDTFVFEKSAEQFVRDGVTPYEVGAEKPAYVYWGTSTPTEPLWYAYPPLPLLLLSASYAPAAFLTLPPWSGRLLIKLPVILAALTFAYLARRLVQTAPNPVRDPLRQGVRVENFLLFNPLLIIVSTIWGQFEPILLCFLAASVLMLRAERWTAAGAFWGLACLIKIFPVYLGPILLVWMIRRSGLGAAVRYFGMGLLVFAAVSLPFYLLQPQGFLEQVFIMHGERQPARFAPIAFLYHGLRWASRRFPGTLPEDAGLSDALGTLSFTLTAFVLCILTIASTRHAANERALLLWSALGLGGGILVTKIVSEQYCLLALGLLTLYAFHPAATPAGIDSRRMRALLVTLTTFVVLAGFLDHALFLVFVPPDVAQVVLHTSVPQAILALSGFFGLTISQFRTVLGILSGAGLAVPFYFAIRIIGPQLGHGLLMAAHALQGARPAPRSRIIRFTVAATLLCLMLPALAMGAVAPKREAPPADAGLIEQGPMLLAHYRSDWFNPLMRPELPGGSWRDVQYSPAGGYYNSIAYKLTEDIQMLRAAHVDALVVPFNPAFESGARAVAQISNELGMPYALEVDLVHLLDEETGRVAFTSGTALDARELVDGPMFDYWDAGYHLRLAPERPRLLFIAGVNQVGYAFTDDERQHVAGILADLVDRPTLQSLQTPGRPLWQSAPRSMDDLQGDTPHAALWRRAYEAANAEWWTQAFAVLKPDNPQSRLELVVDATPTLPPRVAGLVKVLGTYTPVRAHANTTQALVSTDLIRTLRTDPVQPEAAQAQWDAARASQALGVLVPWNDFDVGLCVEPTIEHGDGLLLRVQSWSEAA